MAYRWQLPNASNDPTPWYSFGAISTERWMSV
jgi:hypothetical protein